MAIESRLAEVATGHVRVGILVIVGVLHCDTVYYVVVWYSALGDVAAPLVLNQVVALEGRLEHKVVLLVVRVQQVLLQGQ